MIIRDREWLIFYYSQSTNFCTKKLLPFEKWKNIFVAVICCLTYHARATNLFLIKASKKIGGASQKVSKIVGSASKKRLTARAKMLANTQKRQNSYIVNFSVPIKPHPK